jgi:hypothetical protein
LGQVSKVHVELGFPGETLLVDFAEESGGETEKDLVWEKCEVEQPQKNLGQHLGAFSQAAQIFFCKSG